MSVPMNILIRRRQEERSERATVGVLEMKKCGVPD